VACLFDKLKYSCLLPEDEKNTLFPEPKSNADILLISASDANKINQNLILDVKKKVMKKESQTVSMQMISSVKF
jgi:hypothetical protein